MSRMAGAYTMDAASSSSSAAGSSTRELEIALLSRYAGAYRETAVQPALDAPLAADTYASSLDYGAAGLAYAHWHEWLVAGGRDMAALDEADRCLQAIARPATGPDGGIPGLHGSLLHGSVGIELVRALVAHGREDSGALDRATARLATLCQTARDESAELYRGLAGRLVALAIAYARTGAHALRQPGEDLADHLARSASPTPSGKIWPGTTGRGLAHGSAGPHLALLLWSAATDSRPPPWLASSLHALLDAELGDSPPPYESTPTRPDASHRHRGEPTGSSAAVDHAGDDASLCAGTTGLAYVALWAYRTFEAPRFLVAVQRAIGHALAHPPAGPNLCCGRAGLGFVCLALAATAHARGMPDEPLLGHARQLALSLLLYDEESWSASGLFSGDAAAACLARCITRGYYSGPPGLDLV